MSLEQAFLWITFTVIIVALMAFDLFYLVGRVGVVDLREALLWSALWVLVSLLFGAGLFVVEGRQEGLDFLTGYLIEKTLSIDNIFVFLIIFQYFDVPPLLQPKVLRWGIIGALVMRFLFILAGSTLLAAFHWTGYILGAVILFGAARLATQGEMSVEPDKNPVLHLVRRFMPVAQDYQGDRFFVRNAGVLAATPLFLVLVVIESTDLVFAFDSIPAILTMTDDTFILFTSNAFAILGLRAMYFVLADVADRFTYLRQGAVAILAFVGVKLLVSDLVELPTVVPLLVVAAILAVSIVLSLAKTRRKPGEDRRSPTRRLRLGL